MVLRSCWCILFTIVRIFWYWRFTWRWSVIRRCGSDISSCRIQCTRATIELVQWSSQIRPKPIPSCSSSFFYLGSQIFRPLAPYLTAPWSFFREPCWPIFNGTFPVKIKFLLKTSGYKAENFTVCVTWHALSNCILKIPKLIFSGVRCARVASFLILQVLELRPIEMAQTSFLHSTRPHLCSDTINSLELSRKYRKTISNFYQIFARFSAVLSCEVALITHHFTLLVYQCVILKLQG